MSMFARGGGGACVEVRVGVSVCGGGGEEDWEGVEVQLREETQLGLLKVANNTTLVFFQDAASL